MRRFEDQASEALSPTTPRGRARSAIAAIFARAGIAGADLDARVLVCAACGVDHAGLVRDPDTPLGSAAAPLTALAARRLARVPVSRILGRREFWGLSFAIGPDVLDPRPETEGVVGAVLDAVGGRRDTSLRVLDLGTGSGAILCALLHELPGAFGIGVDRSPAACRSARANARDLGLAIRSAFLCGSWSDALDGRFDIVVANPPYVPRDNLAGLDAEVREHDPVTALDGGADGLDAYRALAPRLGPLLRTGGVAALECGHQQGTAVAQLLGAPPIDVRLPTKTRPPKEVRLLKDLAGLDRVVVATWA